MSLQAMSLTDENVESIAIEWVDSLPTRVLSAQNDHDLFNAAIVHFRGEVNKTPHRKLMELCRKFRNHARARIEERLKTQEANLVISRVVAWTDGSEWAGRMREEFLKNREETYELARMSARISAEERDGDFFERERFKLDFLAGVIARWENWENVQDLAREITR